MLCDAVASVVMARLSQQQHAVFDSVECFTDVTFEAIAANIHCVTQGQVAGLECTTSNQTCEYIVDFIAVCQPIIEQGGQAACCRSRVLVKPPLQSFSQPVLVVRALVTCMHACRLP